MRRRPSAESVFYYLGGALALLTMASLLGANIWLEAELAAQAPSLEVTRGAVVVSDLRPGRPPHASIVVQYTVRGTPHRVSASERGVEGHEHDGAEGIVRALPVGATVPVYYHPGEPAKSFLARPGAAGPGVVVAAWVGIVLCVLAAIYILASLVRRFRPPSRAATP